ncbi:MAG: response regulator transcription factor [Chitinophagaceae bacterium]
MSAKILIVEDEPLICEDLAFILTKEGYQIIGQAYDGLSALDIIHNSQPEIVLLDIALNHQISGLDVAKIINDKYKLPFIFITSFSDKHTLNEAKSLLPEGYIVKPFRKKDILATLEIVSHRINLKKQQSRYLHIFEINKTIFNELTLKEYDIIIDIAEGLSNDQISEKHFISLNTVKTHVKRIFAKLDIVNRGQIASRLYRS